MFCCALGNSTLDSEWYFGADSYSAVHQGTLLLAVHFIVHWITLLTYMAGVMALQISGAVMMHSVSLVVYMLVLYLIL